MKAKQIYFTPAELEALTKALSEWEDMLDDEEKCARELLNGLGTAWRKIAEAQIKK